MRLAILVDIVTIAAGITIILMAADDGAGDAAQDCANGRTRARSDARKN